MLKLQDIHDAARGIKEALIANGFPNPELNQVMCVGEEAGEFIGAYRRFAKMARRNGSWKDVQMELADVIIAAFTAASIIGIDIDTAIENKLNIIFSRGWREEKCSLG
jgi:NTP pyrophosphatase (non-canonical NTP hydrolase)